MAVALCWTCCWTWGGDADRLCVLRDGWRSMCCDLLDLCLVGEMRDQFAGLWAWLWV